MVVWCGWGLFRAGGANRGTDTIFDVDIQIGNVQRPTFNSQRSMG